MRQLATMLLPPLAILIAVALIGPFEPGGRPGPCPVSEDAESSAPVRQTKAGGLTDASPAEVLEFRPTGPQAPAPGESGHIAVGEVDADTASARALVFALSFAADSTTSRFPTLEVNESARLLTRHPETAPVYVEALADASRPLRAILAHTFHRVEDDLLKTHLLKAYHESDPTAARLRELLADQELILSALEGHSDADLLYDLIGRLGAPLLGTPEIKAALLDLIRNSDDPKIRNRALSRVGRIDDADVRELLVSTVADPQRDPLERQTAARVLARRPGPDTIRVFLDIISRNEPAPLIRFAAIGLKTDADVPEVAEVLLDLLLAESADQTARKNAASALSHTIRTAPEGNLQPLEERLRSALTDLSRQETSQEVLVHAMGELSRGLEGQFDDDLVGILKAYSEEQFQVMLVSDPTLKRFQEAL